MVPSLCIGIGRCYNEMVAKRERRLGCPTRKLTLTTSWQRYHASGVVPARTDGYSSIQVRLVDDGRIWADALQFETGEEPTAFEDQAGMETEGA